MHINNDNILLDPNEILRKKSVDVDLPLSEEHKALLTDMLQYVRNTHDEEYCENNNCRASVGIAAPQIGYDIKLLAISIETEDGDIEYALANPKIIANSTMKAYLENGESCLSVIPDVEGIVPRYNRITVRAYNLLTDKIEAIKLSGYPSIVMQHEIDHLYGHLYYDHINKADPFKPIEDAIVI